MILDTPLYDSIECFDNQFRKCATGSLKKNIIVEKLCEHRVHRWN